MNFPQTNLSPFHSEVLEQTRLGQLSGSQQLFCDRYEILRMLGRGGFGVTFLAKDTSLPGHPLCVIKQLCPKFKEPQSLETARIRFEREAKTLSKLGSHSQIPMLLNYFVVEGEFYLIQEYVHGATLARLVRRMGPFSELAVKNFLFEMLPVLQYIHQNQVIHRDIKPQNIILCQEDRRLVLIDFGAVREEIALASESELKQSTTQFIGTIGFAPPEQYSLRPVYASDLYALGVTCVYLLTGKGPLEFETDRNTGEILWRKSLKISDSFAEIIDRMIVISLKDRYQSASAILRSLNRESSPSPELEPYLAVQPPIDHEFNHPQANSQVYLPPAIRSAIAIREWKSRLLANHLPRPTSRRNRVNHPL